MGVRLKKKKREFRLKKMGLGLKEEGLGLKERGWVGGRGLNLKDLVFRL